MPKIVLTGGPGAGKTVIASKLAEMNPHRFVIVPEAATAVYSELSTRWDRLDLEGRRHVQRLIYQHQVQQEDKTVANSPGKVLLLDRGTIDGSAYWPDGPEAYWQDLHTDLKSQLNRYDAVIWLETAAALGIYDGDASNPVRFESPAGAVESGRKLLEIWGSHPQLHHVGAFVSLDDKIAAVMEIIELMLKK